MLCGQRDTDPAFYDIDGLEGGLSPDRRCAARPSRDVTLLQPALCRWPQNLGESRSITYAKIGQVARCGAQRTPYNHRGRFYAFKTSARSSFIDFRGDPDGCRFGFFSLTFPARCRILFSPSSKMASPMRSHRAMIGVVVGLRLATGSFRMGIPRSITASRRSLRASIRTPPTRFTSRGMVRRPAWV